MSFLGFLVAFLLFEYCSTGSNILIKFSWIATWNCCLLGRDAVVFVQRSYLCCVFHITENLLVALDITRPVASLSIGVPPEVIRVYRGLGAAKIISPPMYADVKNITIICVRYKSSIRCTITFIVYTRHCKYIFSLNIFQFSKAEKF